MGEVRQEFSWWWQKISDPGGMYAKSQKQWVPISTENKNKEISIEKGSNKISTVEHIPPLGGEEGLEKVSDEYIEALRYCKIFECDGCWKTFQDVTNGSGNLRYRKKNRNKKQLKIKSKFALRFLACNNIVVTGLRMGSKYQSQYLQNNWKILFVRTPPPYQSNNEV